MFSGRKQKILLISVCSYVKSDCCDRFTVACVLGKKKKRQDLVVSNLSLMFIVQEPKSVATLENTFALPK